MPITLGFLIPDVYSRHFDVPVNDKFAELMLQLERFTNHKFVSTEWEVYNSYEHMVGDENGKYQCMCSCDKLQSNFVVQHKPTQLKFTVGSLCINKFGNEEMCIQRNALRRGNMCAGNKIIRDRRTTLGRKGQCDDHGCKCKLPRCAFCSEIDCTCPKCDHCTRIKYKCVCRTCSKCKNKEYACTCPLCHRCHAKKCTCTRCKKCFWYQSECKCPPCDICGKPDALCACPRCTKCKEKVCVCPTCTRCPNKVHLCACKRCESLGAKPLVNVLLFGITSVSLALLAHHLVL